MKKAVVLGMILLALGCMAYADATTVGLDFGRTQINIASGSSASGSEIMSGWQAGFTGYGNIPVWPPGQRIDFQFAYSNDHTAFNVTYYMMNGQLAPLDSEGSAGIVNLYGTLKLMPDMFKVLVGEFNGDGWDDFRMDSAHPIHDMSNNNVGRFQGWGAIGVLQPKDSGFEAMFGWQTTDPGLPLSPDGDATNGGAVATFAETATNINVAASYTVPNMIKISAGSQPDIGLALNRANRNIWGRAQLLMVPNLTLGADVRYWGFDQATKVNNINADVQGVYDMKPLTIIWVAFLGSQETLGVKVMSWSVYPELIYNMGAISLGLYGGLAGNDQSGSGIVYTIEPYVKLNDFGLRVSFQYEGNSASGMPSYWQIPVLIDWGF
ncbi:MAG: hypothetical protein ABSB63_19745 [Spirochaetia bacterium]|jgi:hypothetical protein